MSVQWSPARSSPGRGWILRIPCVEEVSRSRNEAAREKGHAMAQYLISFPSNAMDQIPEEEMPDVANAAHAVCQEAIDAGVYLLAGGLDDRPASIVATREEALKWAAKVAAACRCTKEARAIGFDPELDEMLSEAASRRRRHDDV